MQDPFPTPPLMKEFAAPIARLLHLTTLPLHAHEILFAFVFYHFTQHILSPVLSRVLFPHAYSSLNKRTRINWDVHFVSLVQSVLICFLALWVLWNDKEVADYSWQGRIWGYSGNIFVKLQIYIRTILN